MKKTPEQYDQLFEDLMEYSEFTDVTDVNIKEMMKQLKEDAEERGIQKSNKFFSKKLLFEMSEAKSRIIKKGGFSTKTKETKFRESTKSYKTLRDAEMDGMTIGRAGKVIYRSSVFFKKSQQTRIVFRDENGRFVKKPEYE